MCIIVVKEKGQVLPSDEILKNCFTRNADGAGFMYNEGGKVHIKKGFMELEELKKELKRIENIKDKGVVLHFRIGTAGKNSAENTHPYEITKKFWNYKKLDNICSLGMAHNGIISKYNPSGVNKHDFNDTQLYILKRLSKLPHNFYKDKKTLEILGSETNSRLAFLDGNGEITTCGAGWVIDDGIKYSNTSYIKYDFDYTSKWDNYYNNYCYNKFYDSYGWEFDTFEEMAEVIDNMLQVTNKSTIYLDDGREIAPKYYDNYFADEEYQELYKLDIQNKSLDFVGNYEIIF